MKNRAVWLYHAAGEFAGKKLKLPLRKALCHRRIVNIDEGSACIGQLIHSGKPFLAGRMGLFETACMRMAEFEIKDKYALTVHNMYDCAGFFPDDPALAPRFHEVMRDTLGSTDLIACNREFLENVLIDCYTPKSCMAVNSLRVYDIFRLKEPWSAALAGRRVLVVTSFPESVEHQYACRQEIYPGTDILPEFAELKTYRPLMTIGDMRDERFADWFEALDFMKGEIAALDFDTALLACGAYGFPLAASIKESGRQAICMGGVLQILFGILGRRWDGSRFGGPEHMHESLKRYVNPSWIYPLEERPPAADGVEYGPYWE